MGGIGSLSGLHTGVHLLLRAVWCRGVGWTGEGGVEVRQISIWNLGVSPSPSVDVEDAHLGKSASFPSWKSTQVLNNVVLQVS